MVAARRGVLSTSAGKFPSLDELLHERGPVVRGLGRAAELTGLGRQLLRVGFDLPLPIGLVRVVHVGDRTLALAGDENVRTGICPNRSATDAAGSGSSMASAACWR